MFGRRQAALFVRRDQCLGMIAKRQPPFDGCSEFPKVFTSSSD